MAQVATDVDRHGIDPTEHADPARVDASGDEHRRLGVVGELVGWLGRHHGPTGHRAVGEPDPPQRPRSLDVAAAQVGAHEDGRETFGHSLVVDPWGKVLLDMGGEEAGLGFCDIDLTRIVEVRAQVPSLANRREIAK